MRRGLLKILACPSCRGKLSARVFEETGDRISYASLACASCNVHVPVARGFALFTELQDVQLGLKGLRALGDKLFQLDPTTSGPTNESEAWENHARQRIERGVWEAYAAFQPFNESQRAAIPLMPVLADAMAPGDYVLDPWCRTGWSGEWLAGALPDQQIVALWEGESSVLGYRGFTHWLAEDRRAPNLDIVFARADRPLPFRDQAFGGVFAYDVLHRFGRERLGAECLRVAGPRATLLFPHLHLTNSAPEPYFQRGCEQIHGRDYRAWLDKALAGDTRRGWVFGEPELFEAAPGEALASNPDTASYNGDVLIAARDHDPVAPSPRGLSANDLLLVNPLFRLDLRRSQALIDDSHLAGEVGHLLERHPIYRDRLPGSPLDLSPADWARLILAVTGHSQGEILERTGGEGAERLIAAELLLPVRCSAAAHAMQRFHANQTPLAQPLKILSARLWERWRLDDEPALRPAGAAPLSGREFNLACAAAQGALKDLGMGPGAWLWLPSDGRGLGLPILIGAVGCGISVALGERPARCDLALDEAALFDGGDAFLSRMADQDGEAMLQTNGDKAELLLTGGLTLPAASVIEAASALSQAMGRRTGLVTDLGHPGELIGAFAALFDGRAVTTLA